MNAMFKMFVQFFNAFTKFGVAAEQLGNTVVNITTWTEESTGAFVDEARATRQKNALLLAKDIKEVKAAGKAA